MLGYNDWKYQTKRSKWVRLRVMRNKFYPVGNWRGFIDVRMSGMSWWFGAHEIRFNYFIKSVISKVARTHSSCRLCRLELRLRSSGV